MIAIRMITNLGSDLSFGQNFRSDRHDSKTESYFCSQRPRGDVWDLVMVEVYEPQILICLGHPHYSVTPEDTAPLILINHFI
jgi:hypothetical protein